MKRIGTYKSTQFVGACDSMWAIHSDELVGRWVQVRKKGDENEMWWIFNVIFFQCYESSYETLRGKCIRSIEFILLGEKWGECQQARRSV